MVGSYLVEKKNSGKIERGGGHDDCKGLSVDESKKLLGTERRQGS